MLHYLNYLCRYSYLLETKFCAKLSMHNMSCSASLENLCLLAVLVGAHKYCFYASVLLPLGILWSLLNYIMCLEDNSLFCGGFYLPCLLWWCDRHVELYPGGQTAPIPSLCSGGCMEWVFGSSTDIEMSWDKRWLTSSITTIMTDCFPDTKRVFCSRQENSRKDHCDSRRRRQNMKRKSISVVTA